MTRSFTTKSAEETTRLGEKLGRRMRGGEVIALCGELGSGKTVLAKGIARGLGVRRGKDVNSPSFVILKEHKGRLPLYHFDIYRLKDISEFSTVGYAEYFYGKGVSVIEWADKIIPALPKDFLEINFAVLGEKRRRISMSPHGKRYKGLTKKLC